MILKSGYICFSWIDNAIPCFKWVELDAEERLQQESIGCEDSVRQSDEHTCMCSMVHLLKQMFMKSTTFIYIHLYRTAAYEVNGVELKMAVS